MQSSSMTALVSAFARAYHAKNSEVKIFDDSMAKQILTREEYEQIGEHMTKGIQYFCPGFEGSEEEALEWIVNHQLGPTPLGRAAYCEQMLENAVLMGAKQYLILAAGYDTFAYRQPQYGRDLQIFEIDHPLTSQDKQQRVKRLEQGEIPNVHYIEADFNQPHWEAEILQEVAFNQGTISFCSLLGLSYYVSEEAFEKLLNKLGRIIPRGSSMVFDYPETKSEGRVAGGQVSRQEAMAKQAGEAMNATYTYSQIEKILERCGFLIYEHLTPVEITESVFGKYNETQGIEAMRAFPHVNYCLAVKQ